MKNNQKPRLSLFFHILSFVYTFCYVFLNRLTVFQSYQLQSVFSARPDHPGRTDKKSFEKNVFYLFYYFSLFFVVFQCFLLCFCYVLLCFCYVDGRERFAFLIIALNPPQVFWRNLVGFFSLSLPASRASRKLRKPTFRDKNA